MPVSRRSAVLAGIAAALTMALAAPAAAAPQFDWDHVDRVVVFGDLHGDYGKFHDMLLAVMHHPAMLYYLNNASSVGPHSPLGLRRDRGLNENLARESLELHTVSPAAGLCSTVWPWKPRTSISPRNPRVIGCSAMCLGPKPNIASAR